jgi:hypothetical protein
MASNKIQSFKINNYEKKNWQEKSKMQEKISKKPKLSEKKTRSKVTKIKEAQHGPFVKLL